VCPVQSHKLKCSKPRNRSQALRMRPRPFLFRPETNKSTLPPPPEWNRGAQASSLVIF
jgi:hypothetical protein